MTNMPPRCQASSRGAAGCWGGSPPTVTTAADNEALDAEQGTALASFDFTEVGELTLFINESQVAFLEDKMWERGVLSTEQMAGAFQILRSNDLIWSVRSAPTRWASALRRTI